MGRSICGPIDSRGTMLCRELSTIALAIGLAAGRLRGGDGPGHTAARDGPHPPTRTTQRDPRHRLARRAQHVRDAEPGHRARCAETSRTSASSTSPKWSRSCRRTPTSSPAQQRRPRQLQRRRAAGQPARPQSVLRHAHADADRYPARGADDRGRRRRHHPGAVDAGRPDRDGHRRRLRGLRLRTRSPGVVNVILDKSLEGFKAQADYSADHARRRRRLARRGGIRHRASPTGAATSSSAPSTRTPKRSAIARKSATGAREQLRHVHQRRTTRRPARRDTASRTTSSGPTPRSPIPVRPACSTPCLFFVPGAGFALMSRRSRPDVQFNPEGTAAIPFDSGQYSAGACPIFGFPARAAISTPSAQLRWRPPCGRASRR